jgi:hypothetical protein
MRFPAMAILAIRSILSLHYRDTAAIGAKGFRNLYLIDTYEFLGNGMFIETSP